MLPYDLFHYQPFAQKSPMAMEVCKLDHLEACSYILNISDMSLILTSLLCHPVTGTDPGGKSWATLFRRALPTQTIGKVQEKVQKTLPVTTILVSFLQQFRKKRNMRPFSNDLIKVNICCRILKRFLIIVLQTVQKEGRHLWQKNNTDWCRCSLRNLTVWRGWADWSIIR